MTYSKGNNLLEDAKRVSYDNGFTKILRTLLNDKGWDVQVLARKLDIKPQSLSNKLYRDRFTYQEVIMILYILDSDINIKNNLGVEIFHKDFSLF